jgi:CopG family transcriptional regulator/antitoxin EndoAI
MNTIIKSSIHKRVDITLPRETVSLLERISKKGDRSRFVDQAILFYAKEMSRANLRKLLKEGAIKNAARDLSIAEEWFPLENEVWPKI